MLNDSEELNARVGRDVLDDALKSIGRNPVSTNPDFRETEPAFWDVPTVALEKPGIAPFRFVFGDYLDVWVGPHSEVVPSSVCDGDLEEARRTVENVLRSHVTTRVTRFGWFEIAFHLGEDPPWRRLKSRPLSAGAGLAPHYAPYAEDGI